MKKVILLMGFLSLNFYYSQVGINTSIPNSTLTVNGSFEADYKQIESSAYTLTSNDHYVTYNGSSNTVFTLPDIGTGTTSFTGRIYRIKNVSAYSITLQASGGNTLRVDNAGVSTFTIPTGAYAEVVNNSNASGGTWDLSFSANPRPSNIEIYGVQLQIPPHSSIPDWTNHGFSTYDSGSGSDAWWVISKTATSYTHTNTYHNTSRMTLVYEYQGPPFNISNIYPILTAGNNSSFPDVFTASFVNLANNGTGGKTRLTVSVARIDFVGNNGSNTSNWLGSFLLNVLLAKKIN